MGFICCTINLSLTLKEEYTIRMAINILRSKLEEVIKNWRKLSNEEVHNFYYTPAAIKCMKRAQGTRVEFVQKFVRKRK